MTCVGGVLYAQYQLYVNPETVSGIGISLQMVFGVIAGGMFVMLGPDGRRGVPAGCCRRRLRVLVGNQVHGLDLLIYGAAADPVHHLHAQGHPGHRAGEGAGRRREALRAGASGPAPRPREAGLATRTTSQAHSRGAHLAVRSADHQFHARVAHVHFELQLADRRPAHVPVEAETGQAGGMEVRSQQRVNVVHGVDLCRAQGVPVDA